ncbi:hypothetical protein AAC387_Pa05g2713 [Persea americana]
MFKNTFQSGFLSILYSLGSKPLQIWDKEGVCCISDISLYLAQLHLRVQEIFCEGKIQPGSAKIMLRDGPFMRYIDGDKWGGLLMGRLDCIVL